MITVPIHPIGPYGTSSNQNWRPQNISWKVKRYLVLVRFLPQKSSAGSSFGDDEAHRVVHRLRPYNIIIYRNNRIVTVIASLIKLSVSCRVSGRSLVVIVVVVVVVHSLALCYQEIRSDACSSVPRVSLIELPSYGRLRTFTHTRRTHIYARPSIPRVSYRTAMYTHDYIIIIIITIIYTRIYVRLCERTARVVQGRQGVCVWVGARRMRICRIIAFKPLKSSFPVADPRARIRSEENVRRRTRITMGSNIRKLFYFFQFLYFLQRHCTLSRVTCIQRKA